MEGTTAIRDKKHCVRRGTHHMTHRRTAKDVSINKRTHLNLF